ncbi:MAG: hypothetical protein O2809_10725 [Proteobacteria bacterium]|nr:hypothetical protein [Pseudomonadota bacterium]
MSVFVNHEALARRKERQLLKSKEEEKKAQDKKIADDVFNSPEMQLFNNLFGFGNDRG